MPFKANFYSHEGFFYWKEYAPYGELILEGLDGV